MLKLIKLILVIALIAAAAYFLFFRTGNWSSNVSNVNLSEEGVMNLASTTGQVVKNQAQGVFYDVTSAVKAKANDIIASATQQAKNYLFDMFKTAVVSEVNKIGESAGVSSSSIATSTTP
jgi:L-asparagine transporter-like permease